MDNVDAKVVDLSCMLGGGSHDPSKNANSYPMTDTYTWESTLEILANDKLVATIKLPTIPQTIAASSQFAQKHSQPVRGRLLRIPGQKRDSRGYPQERQWQSRHHAPYRSQWPCHLWQPVRKISSRSNAPNRLSSMPIIELIQPQNDITISVLAPKQRDFLDNRDFSNLRASDDELVDWLGLKQDDTGDNSIPRPIIFTWNKIPATSLNYVLEIATDPDFQDVVRQIKTRNTRQAVWNLPQGQAYYWKVYSEGLMNV